MVSYVHQAREQATQQKNKRSEPSTEYNTIGKITDERVARSDILVSSRTKQATQQSITQTDLSEKENRARSTSIFISATVGIFALFISRVQDVIDANHDN